MTTTRLRDRIFAGMGAILFLVTGSALTIMVVCDTVHNKDSQTTSSASSSCTISTVEEANSILEAPEAYKPDGALTSVQTTDLTVGTGDAVKSGDCLIMKYYGTLASDGTKFDENFTTNSALQFNLGAGQVISGWDEGVAGMKVGGVRRIAIPYAKAYGDAGQGTIPAKADLVFVVKILRKVAQ